MQPPLAKYSISECHCCDLMPQVFVVFRFVLTASDSAFVCGSENSGLLKLQNFYQAQVACARLGHRNLQLVPESKRCDQSSARNWMKFHHSRRIIRNHHRINRIWIEWRYRYTVATSYIDEVEPLRPRNRSSTATGVARLLTDLFASLLLREHETPAHQGWPRH